MSKPLECSTSIITTGRRRRITPAIIQSIHDKVYTAKDYRPPSGQAIEVLARLVEYLRSQYAYLGKTDADDIAGDAKIDRTYISRVQRQIDKSRLFLEENTHHENATVESARCAVHVLGQSVAAARQVARLYPAKRRNWDWGSLVLPPLKAGLEDMLGVDRGCLGYGERGYFVQFTQEILPLITGDKTPPAANTIIREYSRRKPKDLPLKDLEGLPSIMRTDGSREFTGDPSVWMNLPPKMTVVIRDPTGVTK